MSKEYWEKLKDPRWQRKRLEVMQSADFKCKDCNSETKSLNIHHRFYFKGRDPWEYDLAELVCLCEDCHRDREAALLLVRARFSTLDAKTCRKYLAVCNSLNRSLGREGFLTEMVAACVKHEKEPLILKELSDINVLFDGKGEDGL